MSEQLASSRFKLTPGIVGALGPHAHIWLERRLLELAGERFGAAGDSDYPPWVVVSIPRTPDRTAALLAGGPDPTPALLDALVRLRAAGADFAAIACNTMHAFLPRLADAGRLPLPVVNVVVETAEVLRAARTSGQGALTPLPPCGAGGGGGYDSSPCQGEVPAEGGGWGFDGPPPQVPAAGGGRGFIGPPPPAASQPPPPEKGRSLLSLPPYGGESPPQAGDEGSSAHAYGPLRGQLPLKVGSGFSGRVGLLATTGTCRSGLFAAAFAKRGIELICPDDELQESGVMAAIYGPRDQAGRRAGGIKGGLLDSPGATGRTPRQMLGAVAETLIGRGAEAIVVACSEISLAIRPGDLPVPVVDTMDVLAEAMLELASGRRELSSLPPAGDWPRV